MNSKQNFEIWSKAKVNDLYQTSIDELKAWAKIDTSKDSYNKMAPDNCLYR